MNTKLDIHNFFHMTKSSVMQGPGVYKSSYSTLQFVTVDLFCLYKFKDVAAIQNSSASTSFQSCAFKL